MTFPVVVLGVPYVPPAPSVEAFRGLTHVLDFWDGGSIELAPENGAFFPLGDVGGMQMPPFERHVSTSPALAGSRLRGVRTAARTFGWNLLVYTDTSSEAFEAFDSALWHGLGHPEKVNRWTVVTPAGTRRHLDFSYAGGVDAYGRDPHTDGWVLYQPELIADSPYWMGDPITGGPWTAGASANFYSATSGTLFFLSKSATVASAALTNPGDVASWLQIEVDAAGGAMTDITIEIGGGEIGLPDVPLGQKLVVDTDPAAHSPALLDGVDVDGLCDPWDPRPLPPGEGVPLSITATGTGSISASFVPRYFRAW